LDTGCRTCSCSLDIQSSSLRIRNSNTGSNMDNYMDSRNMGIEDIEDIPDTSDILDIVSCPLVDLWYSPRCSQSLYLCLNPRCNLCCNPLVSPFHTIAGTLGALFLVVRRRIRQRKPRAESEQLPEAKYISFAYLFSLTPPFASSFSFHFYFLFPPFLDRAFIMLW